MSKEGAAHMLVEQHRKRERVDHVCSLLVQFMERIISIRGCYIYMGKIGTCEQQKDVASDGRSCSLQCISILSY
jgi:hypothetical protein